MKSVFTPIRGNHSRTAKSISREVTFEHDVADPEFLRKTPRKVSREVVAEARAEGYGTRTVATILRYADFEPLSRQASFDRLMISSRPVERAALQCLEKIPLIKKVRLIGICISGLASVRRQPERQAPAVAATP